MEGRDDVPVYYVNDLEDDQSNIFSFSTATSSFTENSMSTLTSNEASEYFQEIHGRMFSVVQDSPALLPEDEVEVQRLDVQHAALRLVQQGNYYGPVQDVLAETSERRKRVLDLLTSEGNWVREMATEFPHVDFVSIDIIPLVPHVQLPNILSYEVYNFYNGIQEDDESFDMVHVRHTMTKIKDLSAFAVEVHRVLRPGGLLLWSEFNNTTLDASTEDHSSTKTAPNIARGMKILEAACIRQRAPFHVWREVLPLLDPKCEIWHNQDDPNEYKRGFTSIHTAVQMVPATPWHPTPYLRDVGTLIQRQAHSIWANFRPLLMSEGLSEAEASELAHKAWSEIAEPGTRKLYINYHRFYGFKLI